MSNELAQKQASPLAIMKSYLSDDSIKRRFNEILGSTERGAAFVNSIINVVSGNRQLTDVARNNPGSICRAAMRAATVNLPIDPALGHSAIVPYGNEAVFQIMYRGIIQLCIRSGQYKTIHCSEIYRDELKSHNPITGEVQFNDPATFKIRYDEKRKDGDVVGHYVYFKLTTGFEKSDYMTHGEVMGHARRYSKAYQYDIAKGKKTSAWSTDPIPMGNKTVLLRCLKKYGVMSLEMQEMIAQDRETFEEAQASADAQIDAKLGAEPIDTAFEPNGDTNEAEGEKVTFTVRTRNALKKLGIKGLKHLATFTEETLLAQKNFGPSCLNEVKEALAKVGLSLAVEEKPGDDPAAPPWDEDEEPMYICRGKCGKKFAEPRAMSKPGGGNLYVCPNCGSMNFEAIEPEHAQDVA